MHTLYLELITLLFLLLFPIQALAQDPESPSPVTQDGYTIVEYYNFDFKNFFKDCIFRMEICILFPQINIYCLDGILLQMKNKNMNY